MLGFITPLWSWLQLMSAFKPPGQGSVSASSPEALTACVLENGIQESVSVSVHTSGKHSSGLSEESEGQENECFEYSHTTLTSLEKFS